MNTPNDDTDAIFGELANQMYLQLTRPKKRTPIDNKRRYEVEENRFIVEQTREVWQWSNSIF